MSLGQEDTVSASGFPDALVGSFFFRSNRNPGFEHLSLCSLPQYRYSFYTLFECIPNMHGQQMILVLPDRLRLLY